MTTPRISLDALPSRPRGASGKPGPDEVLEQLRRIVSDEAFRRSERLCRFLEFVVRMALEGRARDLKEYAIAVEVYDKDDSFDPRTDPIVRVEASRLRRKLAEYYASHENDPILLRLRTRGYQPVIRRMRPPGRSSSPSVESRASSRAESRPISVAVLPFRDLSSDQSQEFFCEAVTERLTSLLGRLTSVQTIAPTSTLQFADRSKDARRIGSELGVDALLEGSVQRSGRRIRASAILSRTSDGLTIWNETYDRELRDVLTLQDDLAESIAAGLGSMLGPGIHAGEDPGKRALRIGLCRFARSRYGDVDLSIDAFRKSAKADPGLGDAHARLAMCLVLRMLQSSGSVDRLAGESRAAALEALGCDPEIGVAHAALAAVQAHYDRDWAAAEESFLRALNLGPQEPLAHAWYGTSYLIPRGRLEEALSELRLALELEPASPWANVDFALVHYMRRDYQAAVEQAAFVLEVEPSCRPAQWILARSQLGLGQTDRAMATLEWVVEVDRDVRRIGALGRCYALAGRESDARELLARRLKGSGAGAYAAAEVLLALGEEEGALDSLERAARSGSRLFNYAGADPVFSQLRESPRFRGLLEANGLTV